MTDRVRFNDPDLDELLTEVHAAETKPAKQAAAVRAAGFDPDTDAGKKLLAIAKAKDTVDPFELAREAAKVDLTAQTPDPGMSPEGMRRRIEQLNSEGNYIEASRLQRRLTRMVEGPTDHNGFSARERTRQEASDRSRQARAGELWRSSDPAARTAGEKSLPAPPPSDADIEAQILEARNNGHWVAAARWERELKKWRSEQTTKAAATSTGPEPQLSRSQGVDNASRREAEARAAGDFTLAARWERHRKTLEREIAEAAKATAGAR